MCLIVPQGQMIEHGALSILQMSASKHTAPEPTVINAGGTRTCAGLTSLWWDRNSWEGIWARWRCRLCPAGSRSPPCSNPPAPSAWQTSPRRTSHSSHLCSEFGCGSPFRPPCRGNKRLSEVFPAENKDNLSVYTTKTASLGLFGLPYIPKICWWIWHEKGVCEFMSTGNHPVAATANANLMDELF